MTRRPIEILQNHLNKAFDNYPKNITLKDFRADKILMRIENKALTKTRKIITPHSDIVTIFQNKTIQPPWKISSNQPQKLGDKILFPTSLIGRKGGYEINKLAKDLDLK